jgi:hypothetical protein
MPRMTCAGCAGDMTTVSLAGRYGRTLAIDLCHGCNHVWFDGQEDLHLAPGGVLALFEAMGRAATSARRPVGARKPCPHCDTALLRTRDRVKDTAYEYFRCSRGHGKLMAFAAFLRARHFVRDLTEPEVQALRVEARTIRCSGCGAAVDIGTTSACAYCHAPIAVLDANQLAKTVSALEAAEIARGQVDPTWPLRAEQVRRQTEAAFAALHHGRGASPELDLVESGLAIFAAVAARLRG